MISEKDIAFPRLTDAQIASLEPRGRRRAVRAGEVLIAEGDRGFGCYVVLNGAIEMFESSRGDPHTIVVHEQQQFTGDVDLLAGRAAIVTARVAVDGEVLELSASALRQSVDEWPELGEVVLPRLVFVQPRSELCDLDPPARDLVAAIRRRPLLRRGRRGPVVRRSGPAQRRRAGRALVDPAAQLVGDPVRLGGSASGRTRHPGGRGTTVRGIRAGLLTRRLFPARQIVAARARRAPARRPTR